jgi:hypothetical protein
MNGKEKDSCEIYCYKEPKVRKVQNVLDGRNVQRPSQGNNRL